MTPLEELTEILLSLTREQATAVIEGYLSAVEERDAELEARAQQRERLRKHLGH